MRFEPQDVWAEIVAYPHGDIHFSGNEVIDGGATWMLKRHNGAFGGTILASGRTIERMTAMAAAADAAGEHDLRIYVEFERDSFDTTYTVTDIVAGVTASGRAIRITPTTDGMTFEIEEVPT